MDEILARYATGLSASAVAREFGCPRGSVARMASEAGYSKTAGQREIARRKESIPISERLDEFIMPEPNTGCHLWMAGGLRSDSYGLITINGRQILAHRFMYERAFGPIPPGLFACHRCDTPACVNPDHIFLGTCADNNADRDRKGRQVNLIADANRSKTHCLNGHAFSGENLLEIGARRICRACARERRQKKVPSEQLAVGLATHAAYYARRAELKALLRQAQSALHSPFSVFGARVG